MTEKTALVFGGSRGIGAACVAALRDDGWAVAYTYVTAPGETPGGIRADIRDAASVEAAFQAAGALFDGRIDAVVANAGINVPPRPVADFPAEDFRALIETNVVGAFNVLQGAARHVADGGSILALSTALVRQPLPGVGPYTATKAAVESLLRSMQRELAPRKVRVNGVAPGPVDTDLFRAGKDEAAVARSGGLSPFGRVGRAAEVANVVRFLLSEQASWVAGQIVQPNGGLV